MKANEKKKNDNNWLFFNKFQLFQFLLRKEDVVLYTLMIFMTSGVKHRSPPYGPMIGLTRERLAGVNLIAGSRENRGKQDRRIFGVC